MPCIIRNYHYLDLHDYIQNISDKSPFTHGFSSILIEPMLVKAFILNHVRPTIARNDNYQSEGK